ncbi:MAG: lysophospholipid acyltransferase family protein [Planctomycetaceae bacterium]
MSRPAPTGTAQRSLPRRILYDTLRFLSRIVAVSLFGYRFRFAEPLPPDGGLLVLATHQSLLDPVFLGIACERRLSSLARASLFRFGPFGALIRGLDAVPIDRAGPTLAAMKTVIAKLRDGAALVIYPEGTRTSDGHPGEIKAGFALIAKRAGVPIVPAVIVGAWECWPRQRPFPLPGRVRVEFGEIIPVAEVARLDEPALVAEVARRLTALDALARRHRGGATAPLSPRREAVMRARALERRPRTAGALQADRPRARAAVEAPRAPEAAAPREGAPAEWVASPPPPPA